MFLLLGLFGLGSRRSLVGGGKGRVLVLLEQSSPAVREWKRYT